jgi:hypothetical protein
MCDEDRGEQGSQSQFFWHIASRHTRLRRFLLRHPVECRSSILAGTLCPQSLASCGAKHQSDIYTSWYRNRTQSSAFPNHIDNHPVILP